MKNYKIFRFKQNGERASKPFVYATCSKEVENITSKMRHDYVVMCGNEIICTKITSPFMQTKIISDSLTQYITPLRENAIRTATELYYPDCVKEKLKTAMTENEITHILSEARRAV